MLRSANKILLILDSFCVLTKDFFFLCSFRCKHPLYGGSFSFISSIEHDVCLSKVGVAADYSDSIPDSSNCGGNMGYHPLEDVKERKRKDKMLTDAEIARTVAEVNMQTRFQMFRFSFHFTS